MKTSPHFFKCDIVGFLQIIVHRYKQGALDRRHFLHIARAPEGKILALPTSITEDRKTVKPVRVPHIQYVLVHEQCNQFRNLAGVWFGLADPLEQHTIPINLNRTSRLSKGEGRLALSKKSSQKIRQTLKKNLIFQNEGEVKLSFQFTITVCST